MAKYKDLEKYTFEYLMDTALGYVDDGLDKRKGSYIYDAIAPAMYKIAEMVLDMGAAIQSSFLPFAGGEDLDNLALLSGLRRYSAEKGLMLAEMYGEEESEVPVQLGMIFRSVDHEPATVYTVVEKVDETHYVLEPDIVGMEGISYIGELISDMNVQGLEVARIIGTHVLARDEEEDEAFRRRIIETVNRSPFGGNIADYNRFLKEITTVGDVQIYPIWDGGGTVKLSVIGSDFRELSSSDVQALQEIVDPDREGEGKGIAPIGHVVTLVTPTPYTVDIDAEILMAAGVSVGQIQEDVEANLEEYFLTLRKSWGEEDVLFNYSSDVLKVRVLEAITSVQGVVNVTNLTMNGVDADVLLEQSPSTQELPVLGTVTLTE